MIANWQELDKKQHILAWFLIEAMVDLGMENFDETTDYSKLDVELTVNGIRVPIEKTFDFMNQQINDNATKSKLLEDSLDDISDILKGIKYGTQLF